MTRFTFLSGIYRILFMIIVLSVQGCDDKIEIVTGDDFTVSALPYHTEIHQGEKIQLNITIKTTSSYKYTTYSLRYFQTQGSGTLVMDDGRILQENDVYILPRKNFTLYFTASTESDHNIALYFSDSMENTHTLNISLSCN